MSGELKPWREILQTDEFKNASLQDKYSMHREWDGYARADAQEKGLWDDEFAKDYDEENQNALLNIDPNHRAKEFITRIDKGVKEGSLDIVAGGQQWGAGFLSAERNPYKGMTVEDAKADIPTLEDAIAKSSASLQGLGGQPELAGHEQDYGIELNQEQRLHSQSINQNQRQLDYAKKFVETGTADESLLGRSSRQDEINAEGTRKYKESVLDQYKYQIDHSRDSELWMQVGDSVGASIPSMAASMANPVFGLALMASQTYEGAYEEGKKKGLTGDELHQYAQSQALVQTPFELAGDVAFAGIAKRTIGRVLKEGTPEGWTKWILDRAKEHGLSAAGETLITTPMQTITEQGIGEDFGVKTVQSWEEKKADIIKASTVALMQSGVMSTTTAGAEALHKADPQLSPLLGAGVNKAKDMSVTAVKNLFGAVSQSNKADAVDLAQETARTVENLESANAPGTAAALKAATIDHVGKTGDPIKGAENNIDDILEEVVAPGTFKPSVETTAPGVNLEPTTTPATETATLSPDAATTELPAAATTGLPDAAVAATPATTPATTPAAETAAPETPAAETPSPAAAHFTPTGEVTPATAKKAVDVTLTAESEAHAREQKLSAPVWTAATVRSQEIATQNQRSSPNSEDFKQAVQEVQAAHESITKAAATPAKAATTTANATETKAEPAAAAETAKTEPVPSVSETTKAAPATESKAATKAAAEPEVGKWTVGPGHKVGINSKEAGQYKWASYQHGSQGATAVGFDTKAQAEAHAKEQNAKTTTKETPTKNAVQAPPVTEPVKSTAVKEGKAKVAKVATSRGDAADTLNQADHVEVTAPKGATHLQITDSDGNVYHQPIDELNHPDKNKSANQWKDAGRAVKIEAGRVDSKGNFKPATGDVSIKERSVAKRIKVVESLPAHQQKGAAKAMTPDTGREPHRGDQTKATRPRVAPGDNAPMIQSLADLGVLDEGATGKSVMEKIAAHKNTPPWLKILAKHVAARAGNMDIEAVYRPQSSWFGLYKATGDGRGKIIINTAYANSDVIKLIMHEAGHHLTQDKLRGKGPITATEKQAIDELQDIFDRALQSHPEAIGRTNSYEYYGFSKLGEFLSEAFSNPGFRAKLNTLKLNGDHYTIWERVVNSLAKLIFNRQVAKGSMLEATIEKMLTFEDAAVVQSKGSDTYGAGTGTAREASSAYAPDAAAHEDIWNTPQQEISSADTSINENQMPATFKLVEWQPGTVNADIGGGRFDNASEYLADKGVTNHIYDPFNRTAEHNQNAVDNIHGGQSDTSTANNVLNVIAEKQNQNQVIRQAADAIKQDGTAYILIYEGNKSGVGKVTSKGWQNNAKAETYVPAVRKHFGNVERKGNLIIAKDPIKGVSEEATTDAYSPDDSHDNVDAATVFGGESEDTFNKDASEMAQAQGAAKIAEAAKPLTEQQSQLVADNLSVAGAIAKKFSNIPGYDYDAVNSDARVALIRAAQKFDPSRGANFKTFAGNVVRNQLLDVYKRQTRIGGREVSSQTPVGEEGEAGTLQDTLTYAEKDLSHADQGALDVVRDATETLSERDQKVMSDYANGKTLEEIGRGLGGMSREGVRKIIQRGGATIKAALADHGINNIDQIFPPVEQRKPAKRKSQVWSPDEQAFDAGAVGKLEQADVDRAATEPVTDDPHAPFEDGEARNYGDTVLTSPMIHDLYHGTAADISGELDTAYMSTGEGAQAYGWGHYVAQRFGIAKTYKEQDVARKKAKKNVTVDGEVMPTKLSKKDVDTRSPKYLVYQLMHYIKNGETPNNARAMIAADLSDTISRAEEYQNQEGARGKLWAEKRDKAVQLLKDLTDFDINRIKVSEAKEGWMLDGSPVEDTKLQGALRFVDPGNEGNIKEEIKSLRYEAKTKLKLWQEVLDNPDAPKEQMRQARNAETDAKQYQAAADLIEQYQDRLTMKKAGHVYKVQFDAEPHEILDWDDKVNEQPKEVQEAFKKAWMEGQRYVAAKGDWHSALFSRIESGEVGTEALDRVLDESGESLYMGLVAAYGNNPKRASETLNKAGIKGVQFRDAMSRNPNVGLSLDEWKGILESQQYELKTEQEGNKFSADAKARRIRNLEDDIRTTQMQIAKLEATGGKPNVTRNYVIFHNDHVKIVEEDGVPRSPTVKESDTSAYSPEGKPDTKVPLWPESWKGAMGGVYKSGGRVLGALGRWNKANWASLVKKNGELAGSQVNIQHINNELKKLYKKYKGAVDPADINFLLGTLENKLTDVQVKESKKIRVRSQPSENVRQAATELAADPHNKELQDNLQAARNEADVAHDLALKNARAEFEKRARMQNIEVYKQERAQLEARLVSEGKSDVVDLATRMRNQITELSNQIKNLEGISPELRATINENLDTHLYRNYNIFNDPDAKWVDYVRAGETEESAKIKAGAEAYFKEQAMAEEAARHGREMREAGTPVTREEAKAATAGNDVTDRVQALMTEYTQVADDGVNNTFTSRPLEGAKNQSIVKVRGQWDKRVRELWGEQKDPSVNFARTTHAMTAFVANHHFQQELLAHGLKEDYIYQSQIEGPDGKPKKNPKPIPSGFVQLVGADSKGMDQMLNTYGPPALRDALKELSKTDYRHDAVKKLTGIAMAMKTVGSVASGAHNFLGNVGFIAASDAWSPWWGGVSKFAKAGQLAWSGGGSTTGWFSLKTPEAKRDYAVKLAKLGVIKDTVTVGILDSLAKKANDVLGKNVAPVTSQERGRNQLLKSTKGVNAKVVTGDQEVTDALKSAGNWFKNLYGGMDEFWKIVAFESELAKQRYIRPDASQEEQEQRAATKVRKHLPTYSEASKLFGDANKSNFGVIAAPFTTFVTESVRTMNNTVKTGLEEMATGENGREKFVGAQRLINAAITLGVLYTLPQLSKVWNHVDDDEEEALRRGLPDWQKNNMLVFTGRDKDGKLQYADWSWANPFSFAMNLPKRVWKGAHEGDTATERVGNAVKEAGLSLTEPFTKEQVFLQSLENARRGTREDNTKVYNPQDPFPEKLFKGGWEIAKGTFMPGSVNAGWKIGQALAGNVSEGGKVYNMKDELWNAVGAPRLTTVDPEQSFGRLIGKYNAQKTAASQLFTAEFGSKGTRTNAQIALAYDAANKAHKSLIQGLRDDYLGAQALGMSKKDAIALMKSRSVSQDDIDQVTSGVYKKYKPSDKLTDSQKKSNPERSAYYFNLYRDTPAKQNLK